MQICQGSKWCMLWYSGNQKIYEVRENIFPMYRPPDGLWVFSDQLRIIEGHRMSRLKNGGCDLVCITSDRSHSLTCANYSSFHAMTHPYYQYNSSGWQSSDMCMVLTIFASGSVVYIIAASSALLDFCWQKYCFIHSICLAFSFTEWNFFS